MLKKFNKPFKKAQAFIAILHERLNTTKIKGRVGSRERIDIDTGKK